MRQKFKSQDIAGYRYVVTQLGADSGRKMADELVRALVPVLADLLKALPKSEQAVSAGNVRDFLDLVDPSCIPDMVERAFKALPSERLDSIIEQLAETTDVFGEGYGDAGAPLGRNFDEHFAGRYKAMYQWLFFALKVNFADFFSEKVGELVSVDQRGPGRR